MKKSTLPCTNRLTYNANPITQSAVVGRKRLITATAAHRRQKHNSIVTEVNLEVVVVEGQMRFRVQIRRD
ncbi:hypothetical protein TSUD_19990 [Trifolium subterraneum]|uniref:Uncharacterized protein n=1 Tax=Trifolium subterraneum TaxID=3900 RepID=A0A2Z6MWU9_TRISU|nr:hypothetical protein TSUD_19990 [Trifolium subterraneum]